MNHKSDCSHDHLDDSENCTYVRENETQRVYQCKLCREYFYYPKPVNTPDWWNDLYTDGAGNCFSDADGGL